MPRASSMNRSAKPSSECSPIARGVFDEGPDRGRCDPSGDERTRQGVERGALDAARRLLIDVDTPPRCASSLPPVL